MTRTDQTTLRTLLRRGLAGAAALLSVGLVVAPDSVDAGVRTKSATIAAEADRALTAYERWHTDHNPADYVRFVQSRDAAASLTASDLELDPGARAAAMSQLGVPYRSITSEPGVGFDCSGLTIWAFGEAGLEIPRTSRDQFRAAEEISADAAEPGDFVYYPGHISIFLGLDTMVHAPNSGSHVEAVSLPTKRSVDFADPFAPG